MNARFTAHTVWGRNSVNARNKLNDRLEESRKKLRSALSTLSDGQKSLIEVRYLGENSISVEHLAEQLTKSERSIETLEADALRALMRGKYKNES